MLKKSRILFVIIISCLTLIQCQCSDGPTEPPKDTTRPTILSVSPTENATDISITDSVIITFSEKIKSQSVDSLSIAVSGRTTDISLEDSIVTMKFPTPLDYSTLYTVTVTTLITDLAGNSILSDTGFSFTTEVDPETLPPTVVSTYPASGAAIDNIADSVTVTFSKNIDTTTLDNTTFFNVNGRTGTLSYNSQTKTAIFYPTIPFAYDSSYMMSITAGIKDTAGAILQTPLSWSFTTPTITPHAGILSPSDSMIIGDTITFFTSADNPIGIDTVQFYINNIREGVGNYTSPSVEFFLDASSLEIGTPHTMYSIAFDSLGNFGHSDTITFFYLWQLVKTDGNDGFNPLQVPNDLRKMLVRSTDSTLELRYEYATNWVYPYSTDTAICTRINVCGLDSILSSCGDTAVDLGIYIDADLNANTGRTDGIGIGPLNDIGAEYRIILGLHGGNDAFSVWNSSSSQWNVIYDTTGFINHNIPQNTNIMEIGLLWEDIGNPNAINIVNVNVFFRNFCDENDILSDFMPDIDSSHVRINRENRYIGPQSASNFKRVYDSKSLSSPEQNQYTNPFD